MNIKINDQLQLTLTFPNRVMSCRQHPRQRRLRRAAVWFNHMRQVVDRAHDWIPAPLPSEETQQTKSE